MNKEKIKNTITEMAEHFCQNLCKYPTLTREEDDLIDVCCNCEIGSFVNEIISEVDR